MVFIPQPFHDRLFASQPAPKTGKPDPEKTARFRSAAFPVKRDITEETIPMNQTWHGHSAFRIEVGATQISIDSLLPDDPSPDNGWSGDLTGKNSTQGGDR